jgi:hypothetical protein
VLAEKGKPSLDVVVGVADREETAHEQTLGKEDSTYAVFRL